MPFHVGPDFGKKPAPQPPEGERMHVVTVEFAIVLDGEVPLKPELEDLTAGISALYDGGDMPQGSWRVVSVGPEEDHRDLDPCFNSYPPIPGWPY